MITCKVGNSIVNCHKSKYDKSQLKEWSKKDILKCPACGGRYEYCHGMVATQYFRHKDKTECVGLYGEPETPEHIKGKLLIYDWLEGLQEDGVIENLQLESYIKETKQRPDIYFEQKERRFVIEFQCTPIATEYLKRKELYRMADIEDIWVLGLDKYHIYGQNKTIENYGSQLKLDVDKQIIHSNGVLINRSLEHGVLEFQKYREFSFKDLTFKGEVVLTKKALKPYIKRNADKRSSQIKRKEQQAIKDIKNEEITNSVRGLLDGLREYNKSQSNRMDVRFEKAKKGKRYCCRIEILHNGDNGKHIYFFFDGKSVDCSQRILLNKKTGYSEFLNSGYCNYTGGDTIRVESFIREKIDKLSEGE